MITLTLSPEAARAALRAVDAAWDVAHTARRRDEAAALVDAANAIDDAIALGDGAPFAKWLLAVPSMTAQQRDDATTAARQCLTRTTASAEACALAAAKLAVLATRR